MFGVGLLGLQLQIGLIEQRQLLADFHGVADLDEPLGHLAGDPEADVGLGARLDRADEAALRCLRRIMHRGDQNRALGELLFGILAIAARQTEHRYRQQGTCQQPEKPVENRNRTHRQPPLAVRGTVD